MEKELMVIIAFIVFGLLMALLLPNNAHGEEIAVQTIAYEASNQQVVNFNCIAC